MHRGQDAREMILLEHKIFNVVSSRSWSPAKPLEGSCCSCFCPPLLPTMWTNSHKPWDVVVQLWAAGESMPRVQRVQIMRGAVAVRVLCLSPPGETVYFYLAGGGAGRAPHPWEWVFPQGEPLCLQRRRRRGPPQVPLLSGLSCFAGGQGCQKSFLEKEKQDSAGSLFAAFILTWVFYNGTVMIIGYV